MKSSARVGPQDAISGMPMLRCGQQERLTAVAQKDFCVGQYAIVWIERGRCVVHYPGLEPMSVEAGDAFKRFPDENHHVFYDEGCVSRFVAVPAEVCRLMDICRVPGWRRRVIRPGLDHAIIDAFCSVRDELLRQAGGDLMRVLSRMQVLIADLHQRDAMGDPHQAPIQLACGLLRDHEELSIPQIAERCGLAYSSLRQRFQQIIGCSPRAYRIRCRVEQAQNLLLRGLQVAQVADELGYCDAFRFSAQFKQQTGLSPSAWREREIGT